MNVLVCGARGFVGRAVCDALRRRGHRVIAGQSAPSALADTVAVDFARDVDAATWRPRLAGIDAVVNTVGVLRDSRRRPIAAVHELTPRALFDACAQAGVRRVVQVSALGIAGSPTAYARTKRAAEEALLAHLAAGRFDGTVVRPSVVFGQGGASSKLFLALARLPFLLLPAAVRDTRVQPVAVRELGEVLATLATEPSTDHTLDAVGPQPVALGDFIASLRAQASRAPARVGTLPGALARWSARAGDLVPLSPWCSETLTLLDTDNVADPTPFERVLGRRATPFDALLKETAA